MSTWDRATLHRNSLSLCVVSSASVAFVVTAILQPCRVRGPTGLIELPYTKSKAIVEGKTEVILVTPLRPLQVCIKATHRICHPSPANLVSPEWGQQHYFAAVTSTGIVFENMHCK